MVEQTSLTYQVPFLFLSPALVQPSHKGEQGLGSLLRSQAIDDGFGMGAQRLHSQGRNHVPVNKQSTSMCDVDRQTDTL